MYCIAEWILISKLFKGLLRLVKSNSLIRILLSNLNFWLCDIKGFSVSFRNHQGPIKNIFQNIDFYVSAFFVAENQKHWSLWNSKLFWFEISWLNFFFLKRALQCYSKKIIFLFNMCKKFERKQQPFVLVSLLS